tara:strand:+ start:938 stop:1477 length:540 start_codon:yes stop_codon:yes gene_type:complete
MPVKIHGKEYFTVAERLNILKEDCKKKKIYYSLVTDVIGELDGTCLIKARITLADKERTIGVYTGHAMEKETSSFINKTSYVENCETSAIGRALSSAGYNGSEFCSADEVANAINNQSSTKKALTDSEINEIVLILDDINDKDFTTKIMAQIDKKEINKSNYNRCLTKLDKMIKDQNAK